METLPAPRAARTLLIPEVLAPPVADPDGALDAACPSDDYPPPMAAEPLGILLDVYV